MIIDRKRAAEHFDGALFLLDPKLVWWVLTGVMPAGVDNLPYLEKARALEAARKAGWFRASMIGRFNYFLRGNRRG